MRGEAVALVGRADKSRTLIAKALRDARYDVFECEELAIASRFAGVVVIDDQETREACRTRVQTWLKTASSPRIVIISTKPAAWRPLALAHVDHLSVLAAPAFSWEVVDALRAPLPDQPRRA